MSKANQKFVQADEAVSPVIGVILMVAITVVLAAVVFVLVSNLSKGTGEANEAASATVSSPVANKIYITLVKQGANGPYTNSTEILLSVDTNPCTVEVTGAEGNLTNSGSVAADWEVGETIIVNTDCAGGALASGSTHTVSLTLHGTLILDNTRVVIN